MIKLLKQILITFFTVIATVVLIYGGYTIYAANGNKINFRSAGNFYDAFEGYNREMNEYFNARISKMVTVVQSDDFYQNADKKKLFLPPDNLADGDDVNAIIQKCGDTNFSSYCVGIGSLNIYSDYLKKLNFLKSSLDLSSVDQGTNALEVLRNQSSKAMRIDKESQDAKAVLEATVAAYNEFRLAYPMHRKYQEILKQLTKYKQILKDIRLRVAEFPTRFIDVSTTQCQ